MKSIYKSSEQFRCQLLSRLESDCNYYLGNGDRQRKDLWAGDEIKQIRTMKRLYKSFGEEKPEWIDLQTIEFYASKMITKKSTGYNIKKEQLRNQAFKYQIEQSDKNMYLSELVSHSEYFKKQGKRYGLLKEFKENGII